MQDGGTHYAEGIREFVTKVNLIRCAMRNQVQSARKTMIEPAIAQWRKTRPRPVGLELLDRVSLQLERVEEAQPVKQAEPKPVEPIFQGLWDLISRPKTIEAPQVEVIEQPAEAEPAKPAPRWEKTALL